MTIASPDDIVAPLSPPMTPPGGANPPGSRGRARHGGCPQTIAMPRRPLGLVSLLAVLALAAPAAAESLAEAELRFGYGISRAGTGEMTTTRATPLTLSATAAVAVAEQPRLVGFGGMVVETLDRTTAGATAGIRLKAGFLRFSGGGLAILAPETLWGATASGGVCRQAAERVELCGDLQLTAFLAGSDLANERVVTQAQAVLGIVIEAF